MGSFACVFIYTYEHKCVHVHMCIYKHASVCLSVVIFLFRLTVNISIATKKKERIGNMYGIILNFIKMISTEKTIISSLFYFVFLFKSTKICLLCVKDSFFFSA